MISHAKRPTAFRIVIRSLARIAFALAVAVAVAFAVGIAGAIK